MITIEEFQKDGFWLLAEHILFEDISEILEGQEADEIRIYRETALGKPNPIRYYLLKKIMLLLKLIQNYFLKKNYDFPRQTF